MTIRGPL